MPRLQPARHAKPHTPPEQNLSPTPKRRKNSDQRAFYFSAICLLFSFIVFLFSPVRQAQLPAQAPTPPPVVGTVDTPTQTSPTLPQFSVGGILPGQQTPLSLALSSPRAVVLDLDTGEILYAKNAAETAEPASLTKLLTALTALDYVAQSDVFTVGGELNLVGAESSVAGLKTGDSLTFPQLLDAMLLPSGNDAAYVMAAGVGRKIAQDSSLSARSAVQLFVEKMNEKALSLGALSTHFTCPDGYPDREHVSTAWDMAKIAAAAAKNDVIQNCVSKTSASYTLANGRTLHLQSSNRLLDPSSEFYFPGAFGLKTGYTGRAGNCMAAAATNGARTVLVVVLGATASDARWQDCVTALSAGLGS